MTPPDRVVGVDFSGARDARENVWVAECERRDGRLRLTALAPAAERLTPDGPDPAATMAALVEFLHDRRGVVGLDCPVSLPAVVARGLGAETWRDLVDVVAGFDDVSAFDAACQAATPGDRTYARRATDAAHDSFSPYHFFIKRQTFHAVRDVLRPLVAADAVHVLPMDLDRLGEGRHRPVLLETYPAAVFEHLGRHREEYKGDGASERARREANLDGLRAHVAVPERLGTRARADDDGDALDAVAAAVGTELAVGAEAGLEPETDTWRLEGAIYPLGPHDTYSRDGE